MNGENSSMAWKEVHQLWIAFSRIGKTLENLTGGIQTATKANERGNIIPKASISSWNARKNGSARTCNVLQFENWIVDI